MNVVVLISKQRLRGLYGRLHRASFATQLSRTFLTLNALDRFGRLERLDELGYFSFTWPLIAFLQNLLSYSNLDTVEGTVDGLC